MTQPAALDVQDLGVSLADQQVLRDVTFTVQRGEFVGVTGPNGGGKSTLLRAVLGLIPSETGHVRLFGAPRSSFHEHARVGFLPQNAAHVDTEFPATAREVVAMGLVHDGARVPRKERARRIEDAMRAVDVERLASRRIGALSGGERQRVLLAKALVSSPDLLILDEPTTGVDVASRDRFAHLLVKLNKERGITILLVSHDPDMLNHVVDRILVVDRRIVEDAAPDRLASSLLHHHHHHGGR